MREVQVERATGNWNSLALAGHEPVEMESADSVLWARSRAGDADAFALLFERHAKAIYNYCFRRIGDWGAAEDLLSVVFLEAWRRRRKELPRPQQDVFVLCDWSELSYEDAALALGVPLGTVRSRLSRARDALREPNPGAGHEQRVEEALEQ